jgi:hypothetical protein
MDHGGESIWLLPADAAECACRDCQWSRHKFDHGDCGGHKRNKGSLLSYASLKKFWLPLVDLFRNNSGLEIQYSLSDLKRLFEVFKLSPIVNTPL